MFISFSVNAGAVFLPGTGAPAESTYKASASIVLLDQAAADLSTFPPMMRRRLSALGKMAVAVADSALQKSVWSPLAQMPIVWASRYGDAARSLALLTEQAQVQPLSPTAFGLSVHNGIGAQYSIARGIVDNSLSVAAGVCTVEAGMVEAVALLLDGAPEVLVVCYDAPLPGQYASFHDEAMQTYAWALRVSLQPLSPDAMRFSLRGGTTSADAERCAAGVCELPHGLAVLHYMLSGQPTFTSGPSGPCWCWSRADG